MSMEIFNFSSEICKWAVSKFSELTLSGVFGHANGEKIIKELSASIYH